MIKKPDSNKARIKRHLRVRNKISGTEKGIENVVFDRSGYLYHGRVMELAGGARECGLKF